MSFPLLSAVAVPHCSKDFGPIVWIVKEGALGALSLETILSFTFACGRMSQLRIGMARSLYWQMTNGMLSTGQFMHVAHESAAVPR